MNYDILLTFANGQQLAFLIDVVEKGGYYRTDETGHFLEVSPEAGDVRVYPFTHLVGAEITEKAA